MNEKTIKEAYSLAKENYGFRASSEPPWLAKLYTRENGQDEFRELKQNGYDACGNKLRMLEIIDNEYRPWDGISQQIQLITAYQNLRIEGSVNLPKWDGYYMGQVESSGKRFTAILWERPEGQRIFSDDEFGKPLDDNGLTKIREVAALINATNQSLKNLLENEQAAALVASQSYNDYFLERFLKWGSERRKRVLDDSEFEKMRAKLLSKILLSFGKESSLGIAWNVFGNTDIIKTADGQYYLINGVFEAKPPDFLSAAWLWNFILYSSWQKTAMKLNREVVDISRLFADYCPVTHTPTTWPGVSFYHNHLERLFAAYFVDYALCRSPFHNLTYKDYVFAGKTLKDFLFYSTT